MKRFQNTKTALGHERECCEGLKREQISNHNTIFHIIHIFRVFHFSQYLFFTVARFLCLFHSSTRKRGEKKFNLIPSYLFSEHSPLHTQNTTLSSFGGKIIFRFATFRSSLLSLVRHSLEFKLIHARGTRSTSCLESLTTTEEYENYSCAAIYTKALELMLPMFHCSLATCFNVCLTTCCLLPCESNSRLGYAREVVKARTRRMEFIVLFHDNITTEKLKCEIFSEIQGCCFGAILNHIMIALLCVLSGKQRK